MIGRPAAAAIGLFLLSFVAPALAQDPISDIRTRIAEKGRATVLVRMDVAEPTAEPGLNREGAAVQSTNTMTPRDRLERVREGIASQRAGLESSMAAHGITMQRTYENLPFFVTTVDEAGLEVLLRDPSVTAVTLNRARRPNRDIVRKVIVSDQELTALQAATIGATAEQVAAERAIRNQASFASSPSGAATPSLDTSVGYINAEQVWAQGVIGTGQAIAILDDGIDANHDMFAGKIVAEACFSDTFDAVDESLCANGNDSQIGIGSASLCPAGTTVCEHGSHVAGIAAGNDQTGSTTRRGVAYGATLIPIQVFTRVNDPDACDGEDSCELSYDSATVAALNHVITLTDTISIAAANMSLGSELTDSACDNNVHKTAIDTLRGLGVLTAIASGNAEAVGSVENPGCISTALTVSSSIITVPDSTVNHAPMVDVLAPGVFIVSAVPNNSYASFSGTSMATPHAAGAIALLKSANPTATADEIETALESTGVPTTLAAWTWSTPLIDVEAALASMGGSGALSGRVIAGAFASNRTKAQSNIRFYNPNASAGTATVDVVDDLTGETAGTYSRSIPAGASIQVSMENIEDGASPQIVPAGGDTQSYTLHVNATFSGYIQHILWNPAGGSLTNLSGCGNGLANTVRDIGNVHTSIITGYPSYVMVYNSGATEAMPTFVVTDARDGSSLGNFTFNSAVAPNTSSTVLVSDLVEFFGGTPESDQFHLNLELQSGFTGFAQHIVDNEIGGVLTNMTAKCDL
ncbi:MAG: S8 family serine peptidase [Alphaproteobacteria bacterium]|nr:S8 family serine peptidase [Alphaproteobacteria bacterium]